jgi:hypothetical protein
LASRDIASRVNFRAANPSTTASTKGIQVFAFIASPIANVRSGYAVNVGHNGGALYEARVSVSAKAIGPSAGRINEKTGPRRGFRRGP